MVDNGDNDKTAGVLMSSGFSIGSGKTRGPSREARREHRIRAKRFRRKLHLKHHIREVCLCG
jgi:hypothetical protein